MSMVFIRGWSRKPGYSVSSPSRDQTQQPGPRPPHEQKQAFSINRIVSIDSLPQGPGETKTFLSGSTFQGLRGSLPGGQFFFLNVQGPSPLS